MMFFVLSNGVVNVWIRTCLLAHDRQVSRIGGFPEFFLIHFATTISIGYSFEKYNILEQ